ncbi:MAG TPA: TauD/TfdA family dioxygenase [Acidimicrobiales bacterium]|nr:TauD/TfdA family dioxygenase [Acidimicrobiales bacterium]
MPRIEPITARTGAVVRGCDLRTAPPPATVELLEEALATHGVLFFPQQQISAAQHLALAAAFGRVEVPAAGRDTVPDFPQIVRIASAAGRAHHTDTWHSDTSFEERPQRFDVLHAHRMPPVGGDTLWSSSIAAYDALSPALQGFLEPLTAHHEYAYDGTVRGADHPVICTHPRTGRRALYVNEMLTTRINELHPAESDEILGLLVKHMTQPDFVCRWRWSQGDVAMWDNHFVQHYAAHDFGAADRVIHRVDVQREPPRAPTRGARPVDATAG